MVGYIVASRKLFSAVMTFIWPSAQGTGSRWTCKQTLKVWWVLVGGQEMEVRKEWVGGPESSLGQYLQRLYLILGLCECWACYFLKPKPLEIGASGVVLFFFIKEVAREKILWHLFQSPALKKPKQILLEKKHRSKTTNKERSTYWVVQGTIFNIVW